MSFSKSIVDARNLFSCIKLIDEETNKKDHDCEIGSYSERNTRQYSSDKIPFFQKDDDSYMRHEISKSVCVNILNEESKPSFSEDDVTDIDENEGEDSLVDCHENKEVIDPSKFGLEEMPSVIRFEFDDYPF